MSISTHNIELLKKALKKTLQEKFLQDYSCSNVEEALAKVLCLHMNSTVDSDISGSAVLFSLPGLNIKSGAYASKKKFKEAGTSKPHVNRAQSQEQEQGFNEVKEKKELNDLIRSHFEQLEIKPNVTEKRDLENDGSLTFYWEEIKGKEEKAILSCLITSNNENPKKGLTALFQMFTKKKCNLELISKLNTNTELTRTIWIAYRSKKWPEISPLITNHIVEKYNTSVPWNISEFKTINDKLRIWLNMKFPESYWFEFCIPILLTIWRQLLVERFFSLGSGYNKKTSKETLVKTIRLISSSGISSVDKDDQKQKRYRNLVGLFHHTFPEFQGEQTKPPYKTDKHIEPLSVWLKIRMSSSDVDFAPEKNVTLLKRTRLGLRVYLRHIGIIKNTCTRISSCKRKESCNQENACKPKKIHLKRGYLMLWLVHEILSSIAGEENKYRFIKPEKDALSFVITESARTIFSDGYKFRSFPVELAMSMLRLIKVHCRESLDLAIPVSLFRELENSLHSSQSSEDLNFALQHCQHIIDVYMFGQYLLVSDQSEVTNLHKTFAISALFQDLGRFKQRELNTECNWQEIYSDFINNGLIEPREQEPLTQFSDTPLQKQGAASAQVLLEHINEHNQLQSNEQKQLVIRDLVKPAARAILFHNMSNLPDRYTRRTESTSMMLLLCDLILPWHPSSTLIENPRAIKAEGLLCHFNSTSNAINGDLAIDYQRSEWIQLSATENLPTLLQVLRLIQSAGKLHLEGALGSCKSGIKLLFRVPGRDQLLYSMQQLSNSFYHQINVNIRDWIGVQHEFWQRVERKLDHDSSCESCESSASLCKLVTDGLIDQAELSQFIWIDTGTAPLGYFDVMAYAALPEVRDFLKQYRPF